MILIQVYRIIVAFVCSPLFHGYVSGEDNRGRYIGKFNTYSHQVTGEVYAVNEFTFLIKDFIYDGLGQDTFFWAGSTIRPSNIGFIVPDEEGRTNKLQRYTGNDLTIKLPDGKKITSIRWLAVWDLREVNSYADVYIPEGYELPTVQRLSELSRHDHGVRSEPVVILDSKTLRIPELYYDGNSTDTYFWVGIGPKPASSGQKIPDENGYLNPLSRYNGEDVILELPGEMTVFDIDWFSIWNAADEVNYGSVVIPADLNVPPSLLTITKRETSYPNCEQLHKNIQFSWDVFGSAITFELSGLIDENDYMALGISGSPNSSQMVGADVAISFMDGFLGITTDYNITDKFPCTNVLGRNKGVCPDIKVGGVDNFQIFTYSRNDGITTITYRRNWENIGDDGDKIYKTSGDTFLVWAVGKYNKFREPGFHHIYSRGDVKINFGRKPPSKNCNHFTSMKDKAPLSTWGQFKIMDPQLSAFTVRVGQPGIWRGYLGMTGKASPGLVWYINGLLTPEVYVKRNRKYIFKVEGGSNPHNARYYHPFYITDDSRGGYAKYSEEERQNIKVYAGVEFDRKGRPHPTAAGRLCAWLHNSSEPRKADKFLKFPKFRNSLKLECDEGEPAVLVWTPNSSTPDVLYYQSYTQRDMGYKIYVVDVITSGGLLVRPHLLHILCICTLYLLHSWQWT